MEAPQTPAKRTRLHISVSFRRSYAREESRGTLKNISLSGAFLSHPESGLRAGEKIQLTFSVSGRVRHIQAEVIWSNSFGAGVQFRPTNGRDTQIVDDLIYFVEEKQTGHRSVIEEIFKKVA